MVLFSLYGILSLESPRRNPGVRCNGGASVPASHPVPRSLLSRYLIVNIAVNARHLEVSAQDFKLADRWSFSRQLEMPRKAEARCPTLLPGLTLLPEIDLAETINHTVRRGTLHLDRHDKNAQEG